VTEYIQYTVRLTPEQNREFLKLVEKYGYDYSKGLRQAVKKWIEAEKKEAQSLKKPRHEE
jgi:hypothetical protein